MSSAGVFAERNLLARNAGSSECQELLIRFFSPHQIEVGFEAERAFCRKLEHR